MKVAASFVFAFIRSFHPLSDLQLLQSVFIHLSLSQEEANDACREADHPCIADFDHGVLGLPPGDVLGALRFLLLRPAVLWSGCLVAAPRRLRPGAAQGGSGGNM